MSKTKYRVKIPEEYNDYVARFNQEMRKVENVPSEVTMESLYELDTFITQIYYDVNIFSRILAPVTKVMRLPKWQSRKYKVIGDQYARFTQKEFTDPPFFKLGVEKTMDEGLGWYIAYELSWTLLDEARGGIYEINARHAAKAAEMMGLIENGRLAVGTETNRKQGDDLGVTGLLNMSGVQQVAAGAGNDNDVTAQGDVEASFNAGLTALKSVFEPGEIIVVSTAGFAQECIDQEHATTGEKDVVEIYRAFFATGRIQEWWICNDLTPATLTTSNQRALMFKRSPSTMAREIIYPFQTIPLENKMTARDIKEMYIKADILKAYNANAIVAFYYSTSYDITSTAAGNLQNGLFLSGKLGYHPFTYPSLYTPVTTG
ncbi:MAG: hypothetical protein ACFFDT_21195 [Candidatus Hodarchaeota archaeon]